MKDFGGGLIFPESQHGIPFEDPADEDDWPRCFECGRELRGALYCPRCEKPPPRLADDDG